MPIAILTSVLAESLRVKVWGLILVTGEKRQQPVGKGGFNSSHAFVLNIKNINKPISKCHVVVVIFELGVFKQFSDCILFKGSL